MSTTISDPGAETPRQARRGFVSADWTREVRRAVDMTAWLERGPVEAATNVVPLPKRERVPHAATGGSATILFFTGVTRVRT
jgi:hypothetical protein